MKKQKPLILQIPQPCSESWAAMKPMGLGRFCSHCQKTVTDITNMSDKQIVQLFQQKTDTHCIRAFASQLNRPIALPPQAPTRFYRIALALGLTILSFAAADTYARPRPPLVEQNYFNGSNESKLSENSTEAYKFYGHVLDETGNSIQGVIISFIKDNSRIGFVVTANDGSFSFNPLKNGEYEIEINKKIFASQKFSILYRDLGLNIIMSGDSIINIHTQSVIENLEQHSPKMQGMLLELENLSINVQQTPQNQNIIPISEKLPLIEESIMPVKIEIDQPGQKTFNAEDLKKRGY